MFYTLRGCVSPGVPTITVSKTVLAEIYLFLRGHCVQHNIPSVSWDFFSPQISTFVCSSRFTQHAAIGKTQWGYPSLAGLLFGSYSLSPAIIKLYRLRACVLPPASPCARIFSCTTSFVSYLVRSISYPFPQVFTALNFVFLVFRPRLPV